MGRVDDSACVCARGGWGSGGGKTFTHIADETCRIAEKQIRAGERAFQPSGGLCGKLRRPATYPDQQPEDDLRR